METQDRILKAAEDRIRVGGYNGFSFRDIARDTGLTNAGVHHYFPTKAALVVKVTEVYHQRFMTKLNEAPPKKRVGRLRHLFGQSLKTDGKMCLCGLLAAESGDLPNDVTEQARKFFGALKDSLLDSFPQSNDREGAALALLAQLEGAILLAIVSGDNDIFDQATRGMGSDTMVNDRKPN
ncbi:MAG: TetR/AcrR family transcriptional regulator [Pseudomonadota bacterium]